MYRLVTFGFATVSSFSFNVISLFCSQFFFRSNRHPVPFTVLLNSQNKSVISLKQPKTSVSHLPHKYAISYFYLQSVAVRFFTRTSILALISLHPLSKVGARNHCVNWTNMGNLPKWLRSSKRQKRELSVLISKSLSRYRGQRTRWNNSLCQFNSSRNGSSGSLICDVWRYIFLCTTLEVFHLKKNNSQSWAVCIVMLQQCSQNKMWVFQKY